MKQASGLSALALMGLILVSIDCSAGEWGIGAGVAAQRKNYAAGFRKTEQIQYAL